MFGALFLFLVAFSIANAVPDEQNDRKLDSIENAYYLPLRQHTFKPTIFNCEDGWVKSPDHTCIKIMNEPKSWQSANAQCILLMSDLVTVENEHMNDFVRDQVQDNAWIGLNDREEDGLYRWAHEDWELEGYTNWDTSSLSLSSTNNDCVYMVNSGSSDRNGKWINNNCDEQLPYVCERRTANNRQTELAKSEYCLESDPITNWGQWGNWDECGDNDFVYGFSVKVETYQGSKDDTMANGISFICGNGANLNTKNITSSVERWGTWTPVHLCPKFGRKQNYVNAVRLLVQPPVHNDDDAATLAAEIRCDGGQTKTAGTDHNFPDQSWTKWMNCPSGWAMAGVKTQVESKIGGTFGGDDTALNRIGIFCRPRDSTVPYSSCSEQ